MAVKITNECCGCAVPGYPCEGSSCYLLHVPHYYCDECGDEVETLYHYENEQLCEYCVLKRLEVVKSDE